MLEMYNRIGFSKFQEGASMIWYFLKYNDLL